jgi:oxygen-independent coproporphyrinogen-3 oxidase
MNNLLEKYNTAVPRYTSYPTVPFWNETLPTQEKWKETVKQTFISKNETEGISLYIHLPFCESLCTYCGCNTRITINHKVETPYINAVLKEWSMYLALFGDKPHIKELHLGGGTPTFFNPIRLKQLIESILSSSVLCKDAELSFEAHPNNTSDEHLNSLYQLGFRRLSLGIQDFDEDVQHIINRVQSYESVKYVTDKAREIGYTSINFDLIYGLPLQTERSVKRTIEKVIQLRPDRISFYSYAHVPWLKPGQRQFTERDLPEVKTKRKLYECGREAFEKAGYVEIGMDHFSLKTDALYQAQQEHTLHRNFMGYTTQHTTLLIGLGVSAISDSWNGFVQNEKNVEEYYKLIEQNSFPFVKGHLLSEEDRLLRRQILNIACNFETYWQSDSALDNYLIKIIKRLKEMEDDGLIALEQFGLKVKPEGKAFLRNICAAFDIKLWEKASDERIFSNSI